MKFNPDAYANHPVLRPFATDYPDGEFTTTLSTKISGPHLELDLAFNIGEPTVREKVESGSARCCAYVYCTTTCYSEMLQPNGVSDRVSVKMPLRNLYGRVEIHPSIIALNDISISTDTANEEYGKQLIPVGRYKQLAAGTPWYFAVGAIGSVESAFRIQKDSSGNLEYGEFDFDSEPKDRYITIRMSPETYEKFQLVRGNVDLSMATIYTAALTSALADLNVEEPHPDEHPSGWAVAVRDHLNKKGISFDGVSVGLAAQKLLGTPLSYILREDNS